MKNSPLTTVLLIVLLVSVLASAYLCWRYISDVRQVRAMQPQVAAANTLLMLGNALLPDTVEYAQKHPDLEPILRSVGIGKDGKPIMAPGPVAAPAPGKTTK